MINVDIPKCNFTWVKKIITSCFHVSTCGVRAPKPLGWGLHRIALYLPFESLLTLRFLLEESCTHTMVFFHRPLWIEPRDQTLVLNSNLLTKQCGHAFPNFGASGFAISRSLMFRFPVPTAFKTQIAEIWCTQQRLTFQWYSHFIGFSDFAISWIQMQGSPSFNLQTPKQSNRFDFTWKQVHHLSLFQVFGTSATKALPSPFPDTRIAEILKI